MTTGDGTVKLGSVTRSQRLAASIRTTKWSAELGFGAFAVVCLAAMIAFPTWQGIPFHIIWAGVTVLYAYRQWSPRATAVLLAAVCVTTGTLVALGGESPRARLLELADLPMMALMFLVMVQVVHQRTQALARVRRAAEREREFVRDASHQLRTPITVARGHVELMTHGEENEDATIVLAELERLQRMSDRLLLLASAEHPGFLMLEPVALNELIDAAAKRWQPVAERDWLVDAQTDDIVLVDRARIDFALDTLIENAIKATSDGGSITLRAIARGTVPVLMVADGGIGILPEHRERIFERFARIAPAGTGRWSGTGLGLPIVRAIAEAHGGSAVLAAPRDGWTTFELRLPRFERLAAQPAAERTPAHASLAH